ncbi:MAG: 4-hydroxy-tetrahydrodipicolinate synthase [Clostridiales bacterium]|jgi:4-hydroxy-tetrahydrodipicolinate synthase|nr:4-hydroxy-tetrahydrodipicolinate synthase [Clostridiales bacterium]
MKVPFTGCGTAIVTPMRDGGVDFDALARLIEYQMENGVAAIIPCGTTGEAPTLSGEEKKRVISFTIRRVDGRIPVIAGCGSPSTEYAAEYAADAEKAGADGVLVVTPYYNKATDQGIYFHYKTIADQVKIPVIAYNVPSRTGLCISESSYELLCTIPNLCGIKEASANVGYAERIAVAYGRQLGVYSGCDELTAPIYAVGGCGVVSVLSNIMPEAMVRLCDLCARGRLQDAAALQQELYPMIRALFSEVSPIPVKTALSLMGLCSDEMRLPLCPMSREARDRLEREMKRQGIV